MRLLCATLLLLLASLPGISQAQEAEVGEDGAEMAGGELIVKWRREDRRIPFARLAGHRVQEERGIGDGTWVYRLETRTARATREALLTLDGLSDVEYAEPNYLRRPFAVTPNDPQYPYQWNLPAIRLPQAWSTTKGNASVVVAVVDTGALPAHPDLAGRLLPGYDFISSATNAGDGDGWDANSKDMGTEDRTSSALHGTHVAGIIGAASNNSTGMTGVDWNCKVLPVRALGINAGEGKDTDIVAAIRWAAGLSIPGVATNTTPARVINLSFGGKGSSATLTQAVNDAMAAGAIVVAAVGNNNIDAGNIHPAAIAGVISVGAVQQDLKRAPYSNFGAVVDIMGPGGNLSQALPSPLTCQGKLCEAGVLGPLYDSTTKSFNYRFYEGTSQAAPMVAGVVALMISVNAKLTRDQALTALKNTAMPGSKCSQGCGAGLVNAEAAVAAAVASGGNSGKLPFSYTCSGDAQCQGGICRDLANLGKVCTNICTPSSQCPDGSTCLGGYCVPGSSSGGVTNPGVGSVQGVGGCRLSGTGGSSPGIFWLLLLVALAAARRGSWFPRRLR